MEKNIFEFAARNALRFNTAKGLVTVEDLYHLTLDQLNETGKGIIAQIKANDEGSLLSVKTSVDEKLEVGLELIKHVIAYKQEIVQARADAKEKATKRAKILEVLARKQDASLEGKSEAELLAELDALNA